MTRPRSLATRLRKLAALSWADRWLLLEAFVLLGAARLALRTVPFRRLARRLGPLQVETPAEATVAELAQARRIAAAVARVSPYTPWASNCFPQALAAKYWLHRHGIASTLYLGVALTRDAVDTATPNGMEAHAWLRCGPLNVTGGQGSARYTITAWFGEDLSQRHEGTKNHEAKTAEKSTS
jgi:hypothetical protein